VNPAVRRAFLLALTCLLAAGCSTRGSKPAAKGGEPSPAAPAQPARTVPAPVQVVGRIIAIDLRSLTVVVELGPYVTLPTDYASRVLISRHDDLQPTARLQATSYLRGRTLGTRLVAGKPQLNDEVVFAPATP